jgi:UDPglucose--hexose-1-phosphate uridylyltransferase
MTGPGHTEADSAPEARIDPLTGLRVLIADGRAGRPNGLIDFEPPPPIDPATDPFAEGNEALTPPEVWADRPEGSVPDTPGWLVRVVPNKFPALAPGVRSKESAADTLGLRRGMPELLAKAQAVGAHEVIVNDPRPLHSLADLSLEELDRVLTAWAARMAAHAGDAAYVHLAVNEGAIAGSTLPHTHAQVWGLPFVPPLIARERERMRAYFEHTQGRNLVEDLLVEEIRGNERLIAIDDDCALIAPFASASPYRLAILPRKAEPRFELSESRGVGMLHTALKALTSALGGTPPLNLWLRTAPEGADSFTWRMEIAPRLVQPAGFEFGTGVSINPVAPEVAAAELREALA